MDPQTDNDVAALNGRLNQLPPSRPDTGSLNVPPRTQPVNPGVQDIDDSAYAIGADTPKLAPQPVINMEPIKPVQVFEPVVRPTAPPPLSSLPHAPVPPDVTPPPAPTPQPAPPPIPQPIAPITPQAAAPAPIPPPTPQPVMPPLAVTPATPPAPAPAPPPPPMPAALPIQPTPSTLAPQPAAAAPTVQASYQPPTHHVAQEIVERIDETPQQNSKDIEALIDHNHRLHRLKGFASFVVFVVGVIVAAFLINTFIFQSYYVDGTSMTPTLQNNDRLIIDKVERSISNVQGRPYIPERGQIVVLDSSIVGLNGRDEQLIKRVIGLPGDTVIVRDGAVTVKNAANPDGFDVNSQLGLQLQPTYIDSPLETTIPDGQVFVMGDNRVENGSYDSRAFGPIESEKIVGRLWARILPVDKAQIFD